jgi:hypothetical protein
VLFKIPREEGEEGAKATMRNEERPTSEIFAHELCDIMLATISGYVCGCLQPVGFGVGQTRVQVSLLSPISAAVWGAAGRLGDCRAADDPKDRSSEPGPEPIL